MHTLTVTTVGNSLGVVLPKEVTSRLELKKGDKIFLTKSPDGYRITPYDPEFEEQMKVARSVMKRRRNALRSAQKPPAVSMHVPVYRMPFSLKTAAPVSPKRRPAFVL